MKRFPKAGALFMAVLLLISSVSVYAYDKHVEKVNFRITLNNRDVNIDKEIVTINDSTYLPLRALCEQLLGMDVTWHQDTQTIELWNITKPDARGSHEAPIALKAAVAGEFQAKDKTYVNYDFAIETIERGSGAYSKVENWYREVHPFEAPEKSDKMDNKDYQEKLSEAREKYEEKVDKYMDEVLGDRTKYELLVAKAHIDIKASASAFELNTATKDVTPYCGAVNVDGMDRKYVEYSVPKVDMPSEMAYAGRTILTNGIQEGYIVFRVYKNDTTPRIMYKDGQYLALY